jgi:small GTP-binding protein
VGKTSIATRFARNEFSDIQESTVGAVFLPHSLELQDYILKYEIWDTAGQERFRSLGQMYYKGSKAAIVVFDLTLYDTFKKAQQWIKELNENASADIVIALVGNKLDLEENRQVMTEEGQ